MSTSSILEEIIESSTDKETQIANANKLLSYLEPLVRAGWGAVLERTLTADEVDEHSTQIIAKRNALGAPTILGAIDTGTSIAKDCGLSKDETAEAFRVLKANNRVHQCGRGRGKALVVISSVPLSQIAIVPASTPPVKTVFKDEATLAEEAQESPLTSSDIPTLLRGLQDATRAQNKVLEDLRRNSERYERRIADLESQLEIKNGQIEELRSQASMTSNTTWR